MEKKDLTDGNKDMTNNKRLPHHHNEEAYMTRLYMQVSNTEDFAPVAEVFRQLGDLTRIRIFWMLCHCEECVADIASMMDMSSPAVSHHLKELKDGGLIVSTRNGKEVCYKAAETKEAELMHGIIEKIIEGTEAGAENKGAGGLDDAAENYFHENAGLTQKAMIKDVHDYMLRNMDEKTTIEALSRKYGTNATTLKQLFKDIYGSSIARHMKMHKMEHAARLLAETDCPLAEIAGKVGYESQSKFTAAFKSYYGETPGAYRSRKTGKNG